MKKFIAIPIALLLFFTCHAQQQGMVVIKGTVTGDLKGANKMFLYTRTSHDSAIIGERGHYTFQFKFTEPGLKFFLPEYITAQGKMYSPFGILISQPGTYYVKMDVDEPMKNSELKGPEDMLLYNQFEKNYGAAYTKSNVALSEIYGADWWKQDEKSKNYTSIQKSADSLRGAIIIPLLKNLIHNHPKAYATAYALISAKQIGALEQKESLYNMLSPKLKNTDKGKEYRDYILGLKNSRIGVVVEDFVLPSPEQQPVHLSDMKGKYVLLDFWASWCVPCRRSFPHMREVYKEFSGNKFEIYSISIDEDKAAWLQAVKEEKNPWPQSLDTKNISSRLFAVTAVPSTFLISPKGVIIGKEVGFDSSGEGKIEKMIRKLKAEEKL